MSSDADDRLKKWLEGEEEDDATMELSIADVFALKQQDARNKAAAAAAAEAKATKALAGRARKDAEDEKHSYEALKKSLGITYYCN